MNVNFTLIRATYIRLDTWNRQCRPTNEPPLAVIIDPAPNIKYYFSPERIHNVCKITCGNLQCL